MTVDPGVVRTVEDRLTRWRRTDRPTVVAVDGRSGTGKSSVVRAVAERRPDIVVVEGDDAQLEYLILLCLQHPISP